MAHMKKEVGVKASLADVLPALIPAADMDRETLSTALRAYETRNNVVHNGQRDVEANLLRDYLGAIKRLAYYFVAVAEATAAGPGAESA